MFRFFQYKITLHVSMHQIKGNKHPIMRPQKDIVILITI